MATTEQQKAFIARMVPLAQAGWEAFKILPSLTLAQACCESAYGTSATMARYHAYFGIKATSSFMAAGGKCFSMKTKEEYTVGTLTTITDKFCAYDSDAEGVADHGRFLSTLTRYRNLVGNTDFNDCAVKLRQDGYATSSTYTTTLQAICALHDLTRYDSICTGPAGRIQLGAATLKKGSRGAYVKALQSALNEKGYSCGTADGIFGNRTKAAVKVYQKQAGLVADGLVGRKTKAALGAEV